MDTERINRIIELVSSSLLPMLEALAKVTIPLTLASFACGLIIAVITAIARLSNVKILRWIFGGYVWIFRGTPLLVQLFIVFFGLPSIGITLDTWSAAIIAFSLNVGAYAAVGGGDLARYDAHANFTPYHRASGRTYIAAAAIKYLHRAS